MNFVQAVTIMAQRVQPCSMQYVIKNTYNYRLASVQAVLA